MSLLVSEVDSSHLHLSSEQLNLLRDLKQWVETEADFYGRSGEDFLALFLRSCDFDLELSKKTLNLYYQVRVLSSEWWSNRDLNQPQIQVFIKERLGTVLMDTVGGECPTVAIIRISNFGPDPSLLTPAAMYCTCVMDMLALRPNCQLNGCVFIYDFGNFHWWLVRKVFWPFFAKKVLNSFLLCLPIKVKFVVLVNAPAITSTLVNIARSLLPEVYKNKVQCCRSWDDIDQFIPKKALPDEYGGCAGPVQVHDDASANELLAMSDYFMDDNKYGFQSK